MKYLSIFLNLFNRDKAAVAWLYALCLASGIFWVWFAYNHSVKAITLPPPKADPLVSFDQGAYRTTKKYLDNVANFTLPDVSAGLTNPQPFSEYRK